MKRILLAVSLALALTLLVAAQPSQALDRTTTQRVMKSVVQLIAVNEKKSGLLEPLWGGSGTIISADGLILTNCHVALPRAMWDDPENDYDLLVVALTVRSDEPPRPTYLAEVVQHDPDLDLAVVRVSRMLDGSPVDRAKLNLPALAGGDSDFLDLGDRLYIFGYPGIGGETITFTSGDVSGFTREEGVEGRAWIKTDATVAGGNSGGTAVNEQGELVAIPTQAGAGGDAEFVDCRQLADTNGDGVIDEDDTCIPTGGFINALRPVKLAGPLIEAAQRGLIQPPNPSPEPAAKPPAEPPAVSRLIFAPAINQADQPVTVADSFPSGITDLYLLFDYRGFSDGTSWQPVLVRDGQVLADTWRRTSWSGGPEGTWWVGLSDTDLPNGNYEFRIYYDDKLLDSASVEVGGPPIEKPIFSNLMLTAGDEEGYLLPGGGDEIRAVFDYANMDADVTWSDRLYYEGTEEERKNGKALPSGAGKGELILGRESGFSAGRYRLELYLGDGLATTADFVLAGGSRALFGPITFAEGADSKGRPVRTGTAFQAGIQELYAFFDFEGMQDGWEWSWNWYLNGELLTEARRTWESGERGQRSWVRMRSKDALPEGQYRLAIFVEGELARSGDCSVGEEAPEPALAPAAPGEVEVYGRITDAETKRGIQDALFMVLRPGITVDAFRWKEEEVYAQAETDRRGYFTLPEKLRRGESYSWIITARGYKPILEDGTRIEADVESSYELNIALQRAQ